MTAVSEPVAAAAEAPPGYYPKADFRGASTVYDYVMDDSFVTGIMGPVGSGKSYGSVIKILRYACQQEPDADGWRRTRWLVIRNTYNELRLTTIKTWLEVLPEQHCGQLKRTVPITHHIKRPPRDNTPGLDMEVIFLALDREDDIRRLKSLDCTGAWVNEAIEVPKGVVDMLTGRVGRYPSAGLGTEATWAGILMDTNACDDTSWYYKAAEEGETTDEPGASSEHEWSFHRQPPAILEVKPEGGTGRYFVSEAGFERTKVPDGTKPFFSAGRFWIVNPGAENLANLRKGYYQQQVSEKTLPWLQRFLQAKYVMVVDGRPWVPEYVPHFMGKDRIPVAKGIPLIGGMDAGGGTLSPAAVVAQLGPFGDWRVLWELSLFDIGIDRFSTALKQGFSQAFPGLDLPVFWVDPAGETRDEIFETSVLEHLKSRGIQVRAAPTNAIETRREAIALPLGRLINIKGEMTPGLIVDRKKCPMIHAGLSGKWYRRRLKTADDRWEEKPTKNEWSHACDALSYLLLGGGEHRRLTRPDRGKQLPPQRPRNAVPDFPIFGR